MTTNVQPRVGIVTVTYNSAIVLDDFMRSVLSQAYVNFVLYVVDNASSDSTLAKIYAYEDPRIVVIANADNRGVATGNNQGIIASLESYCEYVLLLNNDTEFEPDLIKKLVAGLAEYPCEMIVPKIMYHDDPNVIWCAGGGFAKWRFYLPFHFGQHEIDKGQYNTQSYVSYAPTCCMLIKRQVFEKIGLMDDNYFVYFDDVDFCLRAMRHNLRMVYLPEVQFTHKVSTLTEGYQSPFTIKYHFRNRIYFLKKHFALPVWVLWLIWFQLHLLIWLLTGEANAQKVVSIQRSILSGLKLVPKTTGYPHYKRS